jgi:enterochelin esterase-like enzyme
MRCLSKARVLLVLALLSASALAQTFPSHEVQADGSITFHYKDSSASTVSVSIEGTDKPFALTKDDTGTWSVTTPSFTPEIYGYSFKVDGVQLPDPKNIDVRRNYLNLTSNLLIPATPSAPWELTPIPHGQVITQLYTSHVVQNYPQNQSLYNVYLPPGYDPKHKGGYPVLYLFHGYSDPYDAWVSVGHANLMLDAMIASGKAVPMIVVMPLGYGDLNFILNSTGAWQDQSRINSNASLFSQALLTEIMPAVEHDYNVAKGRQNRAIAGLSMGGLESLTIGLAHPELFAYIGGFSSGLEHATPEELFPNLDAKKANLKLLWVACGSTDHLLQPNLDFITFIKSKGYDVTAIQTPGAHNWLVWRNNLLHFTPLLFHPT